MKNLAFTNSFFVYSRDKMISLAWTRRILAEAIPREEAG
jgi:hypothetical protein